MATSPMMGMADTGEDAAMMDEAQAAEPMGYVIEISVMADGKIMVGTESMQTAMAEESEGGMGETPEETMAESLPAKNIKDALTMALAIYKNDGVMPEPDNSDEQFAAGYANQM